MQEQVTVHLWVSVKTDTRNKLRGIFLIPKSSFAQVVTDHMGIATVISDGSTNEDLKCLTVEKMQDFLGSVAANDTVFDLFKRCVEKMEYIAPIEEKPLTEPISENPIVMETTSEETKTPNVPNVPNVYKCADCAYTHASPRGIRMHSMKKHKL